MASRAGSAGAIHREGTLAEVEPLMTEHRYDEAATRLRAALKN
jgi:hypothetical protein